MGRKGYTPEEIIGNLKGAEVLLSKGKQLGRLVGQYVWRTKLNSRPSD
jgi:hypothetical protein